MSTQIVLDLPDSALLRTLTRIYQLGQLRKAEVLAEAAKRGLRPPVQP